MVDAWWYGPAFRIFTTVVTIISVFVMLLS